MTRRDVRVVAVWTFYLVFGVGFGWLIDLHGAWGVSIFVTAAITAALCAFGAVLEILVRRRYDMP